MGLSAGVAIEDSVESNAADGGGALTDGAIPSHFPDKAADTWSVLRWEGFTEDPWMLL